MSNVLILGASGNIAQHVIRFLDQQQHHKLKLFVRHPEKLPNETTRLIVGDAANERDLENALQNMDMVYANLGPYLMPDMAKAVVFAMDKAAVKRLIWIATGGIYDELPKSYRKQAYAELGSPYDQTGYMRDQADGAKIIESSDLDYTILRPSMLTDENIISEIIFSGRHEEFAGEAISRKTVAKLIYDFIERPNQYKRNSIGIGSVASSKSANI